EDLINANWKIVIEGILEAPRGPRDIFPTRCYVPAHKNDVAFGARSGECSLPGPVCDKNNLWNRWDNCNTGTCQTGYTTVPATVHHPVTTEVVPSTTVTPATAAPHSLLPVNTEVPVVSVPVTPVSEMPAPVVPAAETPRTVDLPVPQVPPLPGKE
ncbi:MAG TPA: hypothetical protein PKD72_07530, partial [Gemmatales bacterium]|nr:hypothetical protein [Gemmatales bacterium]